MNDMAAVVILVYLAIAILGFAVLVYFLRCMGSIADSLAMLVKIGLAQNKSPVQTKAACPRCSHAIQITPAMEGTVIECPKCRCEIEC